VGLVVLDANLGRHGQKLAIAVECAEELLVGYLQSSWRAVVWISLRIFASAQEHSKAAAVRGPPLLRADRSITSPVLGYPILTIALRAKVSRNKCIRRSSLLHGAGVHAYPGREDPGQFLLRFPCGSVSAGPALAALAAWLQHMPVIGCVRSPGVSST
jgi:hypothetical protein